MRLNELENWLTAKEAGERLGISRQAMQKRLQEGKHRAVKTHHGWLVDPDAIRDTGRRTLQQK